MHGNITVNIVHHIYVYYSKAKKSFVYRYIIKKNISREEKKRRKNKLLCSSEIVYFIWESNLNRILYHFDLNSASIELFCNFEACEI